MYTGYGVSDSVRLVCYSLIFVKCVVRSRVDLGRIRYQLEVKLGWLLDPINFDGPVLLQDKLSSDDLWWQPVLVASGSSKPGDAMVRNSGRPRIKIYL